MTSDNVVSGESHVIIAAGKNTGKRLDRLIIDAIKRQGYADVAVLSGLGVTRVNNAGQRLSNGLGRHVNVDPRQDEVETYGNRRVLTFVMRITIDGGETV